MTKNNSKTTPDLPNPATARFGERHPGIEPERDVVGWRVALITTIAFSAALGFSSVFGRVASGERGYAGDGWIYGAIAESPARAHKFTNYHYCRQLPSLAVHYGLRVLDRPLNPETVTRGFRVLNWAVISAAALAWFACARSWNLGTTAALLGFLALFVNVFTLYHLSLTPVLTDATAYAIAVIQLALWSIRRPWLLFACTLLGGNTHPLLLALGAVLLALPRNFDAVLRVTAKQAVVMQNGRTQLFCILAAGALAVLYSIIGVRAFSRRWIAPELPAVDQGFQISMLVIAVGIGAAYVFFTAKNIISAGLNLWFNHWRSLVSRQMIKPMLLACAVMFSMSKSPVNSPGTILSDLLGRVAVTFQSRVASLEGTGEAKTSEDGFPAYQPKANLGSLGLIWKLPLYSFRSKRSNLPLPGLFLVAHSMCLGLLWAVAVAKMGQLYRAAAHLGGAIFLLLAMASCLWLFSESRAVNPVYPAFVLSFCSLFDFEGKSLRARLAVIGCVAALCLFYSMLWLYLAGSWETTAWIVDYFPIVVTGIYALPKHVLFTAFLLVPGCLTAWAVLRPLSVPRT